MAGMRWAAAVLVSAGVLAAGGVSTAGQAAAAVAVRPAVGGWRIALSVAGHNAPYFSAVTATGPASGWAFEGFQSGGTDRPVAWQLTGRGWHRAAFPGRPGELITGAAASSPDSVWAVSQNFPGPSRVLHWDGTSWSVAHQFRRAADRVAVPGARDVWVFGFGFGPIRSEGQALAGRTAPASGAKPPSPADAHTRMPPPGPPARWGRTAAIRRVA